MKLKKKHSISLKILRLVFVLLCLGGFLYQTSEFLLLYWTYPTVVDIQQIEPSYLEIPAFSICNSVGYNISHLCRGFNRSICLPEIVTQLGGGSYCYEFPSICVDEEMPPKDLQADCETLERLEGKRTRIRIDRFKLKVVKYTRLMSNWELTQADNDMLRTKLEDFTKCSIEFAGEQTECNLENVIGPYYSTEDLPQYCYSIYSKWGQPEKKPSLIPKGSVMHFHFELNATQRTYSNADEPRKPKHNMPNTPSVQIAVHSPYFLPSPYLDGMSYIGGRAYELRLKMSERHLLPAPYQTNCTDYMKIWKERNGKAPINQMGVVQECRVNKSFESQGCVPVTLDYPHTLNLCKSCAQPPCNYSTFAEECGKLADTYTQPCDSLSYQAEREDRVIITYENLESSFMKVKETVRRKILAYECETSEGYWSDECATIDVYILFDRYEITNLTYNPKFESLEVFSVIGGYMGMWLGISLLTVYDTIGTFIVKFRTNRKNRMKLKLQKMKVAGFNKIYSSKDQEKYFSVKSDYEKSRRRNIW